MYDTMMQEDDLLWKREGGQVPHVTGGQQARKLPIACTMNGTYTQGSMVPVSPATCAFVLQDMHHPHS